MTKPLSMFLKSLAQSDEAKAESAAPVARPVEPEPVQRAHTEPERIIAPVESAAVPERAPETAAALFEDSSDLVSPVVEPALLAAEPMMTTPFAMKSVPVEPVLVKPVAARHEEAAEDPAAQAAPEVAVAAATAAKKMVATAKITANKPLSGLFKPAINVKPSLFIKQKPSAEHETVAAAEADNAAEQTVQTAFETADIAEAVVETNAPVVETVTAETEQTAVASVAETEEQPAVAAFEAVEPEAVETVAAEAEQAAAACVAEAEEQPAVAALEVVRPEAVQTVAESEALSVSERAAEKLAVAAAAYAAGQEAAAGAPRGKIALPKLPKISMPKISVPKISVPKVTQSQAAAFKTAVKPIRAAVSAISGVPAVAAVGRFWQNKPVRWSILGVLLPVSGVVAAYAVTDPQPQPELYRTERVMEELPAVYVESGTFQGSYWAQEAVEPGDSLTDVLQRMGVSDEEIREVLARNSVDRSMIQLRAGQSVNVRFDASGNITDVQFFNDDDNGFRDLVALEKVNGKWRTSTSAVEMETMPTLRAVQVRTSARGAMAQAGVPVEVRESLNEIFNDIVNVDELTSGDSIRLLYNSMYFRGQEMATGDILAAEVVKGGKTYQAYYYSQGKGDEESGSYYDQNGKSLRLHEGFNVKPVDYMRVSSPYGVRIHPVLRTVKMHTGIDYAAPTGTPIRATADGVLTFKGWQGGYGNTVILQHSNGIETLYAHMSAFSSAGGQVKAGEVIGYVGSTGRSTGPHLHYEVRKNGQHMNPTAIALPTPKLTPTNMAEFRRQQQAHTATMAAVRNLPVTVTQLD
ncbi:peptidase [Neisseria dentiae]|nr:peptidase [Neisseria dentiae]